MRSNSLVEQVDFVQKKEKHKNSKFDLPYQGQRLLMKVVKCFFYFTFLFTLGWEVSGQSLPVNQTIIEEVLRRSQLNGSIANSSFLARPILISDSL